MLERVVVCRELADDRDRLGVDADFDLAELLDCRLEELRLDFEAPQVSALVARARNAQVRQDRKRQVLE